jgi:hypothetical protein
MEGNNKSIGKVAYGAASPGSSWGQMAEFREYANVTVNRRKDEEFFDQILDCQLPDKDLLYEVPPQ